MMIWEGWYAKYILRKDKILKIIFSRHAEDRIKERGATKEEIFKTIKEGEQLPVKEGRVAYKKNFQYNKKWKGKYYTTKQVIVITKKEGDNLIVITVFTFYIGGKNEDKIWPWNRCDVHIFGR